VKPEPQSRLRNPFQSGKVPAIDTPPASRYNAEVHSATQVPDDCHPDKELLFMKITLELPPEMEAQLRESAIRRDTEGVRRLLVEAFTPTVEALLRETADELTDAQFEAMADQLADELRSCLGPNTPLLSDDAVSREGIYEGHP
jgi:antitoxin ParD1/3/4